MAEVIRFPGTLVGGPSAEERRLTLLFDASNLLAADGELDPIAASLGSRDEWAWSAAAYLKAVSCDAQGRTIIASKAGISLLLGYLEELAGQLGVIGQPPAGDAA